MCAKGPLPCKASWRDPAKTHPVLPTTQDSLTELFATAGLRCLAIRCAASDAPARTAAVRDCCAILHFSVGCTPELVAGAVRDTESYKLRRRSPILNTPLYYNARPSRIEMRPDRPLARVLSATGILQLDYGAYTKTTRVSHQGRIRVIALGCPSRFTRPWCNLRGMATRHSMLSPTSGVCRILLCAPASHKAPRAAL